MINDDVLKVDIAKLAKEENGGRPIKVVANLPKITLGVGMHGLLPTFLTKRAMNT